MSDQTERSFIKFIETKPLDFSPGTQFSYSNSGYWLLGFIIQKVAGMRYEEAVRQYIFDALGMSNSGFDFKRLKNKNKTKGYEIFWEQEYKEADVYDAPGPFSAGAIYSTVEDLYKYHLGLQSLRLLSESSQKIAYTPFKNNYGYGWIINAYNGVKTVAHSGGAAGYRSNFVRIPAEDICIVLLDNTENPDLALITNNILSILFGQSYTIPSEIKVDAQALAKCTGFYAVTSLFSMQVTIEEGRLAVRATGQRKTVPLAQRPDYFYAEEADGFLEFSKDSMGMYNRLLIHQRGQRVNASRFTPAWGLIGSATAKGWDEKTPDISLSEDSCQKGIWLIYNIQLKAGELKFRFNNDWHVNYGENNMDGVLDKYGENIEIQTGIYDIKLDLTDEKKPVYSIIKKS